MQEYDLILSLTTWKKRINDQSLKYVIYTMLKQKTSAKYKVVLVLSTDEFPDKNIPAWIYELDKVCDWFELLWTKENTRAYKKYFPVRRKYPDENICPLDDDSPLHDNFVETFTNLLKNNPGRMIIGTNHFQQNTSHTIQCVRYGAACFRPDSLYDLDEFVGRKYFGEHDDEFFSLLSVLNATKSVRVDIHKYIDVNAFQQQVKLQNVTNMNYRNLSSLWNMFFKDHPNLARQYRENKNKHN